MRKLSSVLMLIVVLTVTLMAQIQNQGLVAWFPFNGNYSDESGSGITLFAYQPPTLIADRYGIANRAYSFDGNTQELIRGNDSILPQGSSPRTISAWIAWTGGMAYGSTIVSYGKKEAGKHVRFFLSNIQKIKPGCVRIGLSNETDSIYCDTSSVTGLPELKWRHVAAVINGSITKLYINGTEIASKTITTWNTEPNALIVGSNYLNIQRGTALYCGKLDDVCIYNTAFNALAVQKLYQAKSAKNTIPTVTSTPDTTAYVGVQYQYSITVSDPDSAATSTISLLQNPVGMTVYNNKIIWTPSQVGSNSITIKVTDNAGDTTTQNFTIKVLIPTRVINGIKKTSNVVSYGKIFYDATGRKIIANKKLNGIKLSTGVKQVF